jgi:beta-galactosidase
LKGTAILFLSGKNRIIAHINDHEVKNYGVMAELAPEGAVIALKQAFVWNIYQPIAYMNTRYVISSSGLDISCKAEFSNKVTFLPRFGIRLFMPRSFDRVEYFGLGPFESYIDKHQADRMDNFSENISDMHEDYIRPQENSSHFGCKHMTVSDGETKVRFTSDEDFSFNASEYIQEELSEKRHNFELEKCGSSVICVDHMMAGVGSPAVQLCRKNTVCRCPRFPQAFVYKYPKNERNKMKC